MATAITKAIQQTQNQLQAPICYRTSKFAKWSSEQRLFSTAPRSPKKRKIVPTNMTISTPKPIDPINIPPTKHSPKEKAKVRFDEITVRPVETDRATSRPVETDRATSRPVETDRSATRPVETDRVQAKPSQTKTDPVKPAATNVHTPSARLSPELSTAAKVSLTWFVGHHVLVGGLLSFATIFEPMTVISVVPAFAAAGIAMIPAQLYMLGALGHTAVILQKKKVPDHEPVILGYESAKMYAICTVAVAAVYLTLSGFDIIVASRIWDILWTGPCYQEGEIIYGLGTFLFVIGKFLGLVVKTDKEIK
jgi:hypothetical protein